jgi:replication factor C large subunit
MISEEQLWTEKYRPKKSSEIYGQDESKPKILDFIKNFKKQRRKAMLLSGPPGSGKTSLIYSLATELGLEIIELNASDFRNKNQIQEVIGKAISQQSLFAKSKVMLIDELEGISGKEDRGGVQELIRLIETTTYPIIMICNDPWQESLRKIKAKSLSVELKALWCSDMLNILKSIAQKEKINITDEAIQELIKKTHGDARASINDLQATSLLTKKIEKKDLEFLDSREKETNIIEAIKKILETREAKGAFDQVEKLDFDDFFLWLDENIPSIYQGKELERAYELLSLADVYKGRIHRQQHWRFLVYISALLTQGIAISKEQNKYSDRLPYIKYKPPSRILKIWMSNQRKLKKKAIAEKLASHIHISKKQAMQELDYLKISMRNQKQRQTFSEELKLEPEELEWLER